MQLTPSFLAFSTADRSSLISCGDQHIHFSVSAAGHSTSTRPSHDWLSVQLNGFCVTAEQPATPHALPTCIGICKDTARWRTHTRQSATPSCGQHQPPTLSTHATPASTRPVTPATVSRPPSHHHQGRVRPPTLSTLICRSVVLSRMACRSSRIRLRRSRAGSTRSAS